MYAPCPETKKPGAWSIEEASCPGSSALVHCQEASLGWVAWASSPKAEGASFLWANHTTSGVGFCRCAGLGTKKSQSPGSSSAGTAEHKLLGTDWSFEPMVQAFIDLWFLVAEPWGRLRPRNMAA